MILRAIRSLGGDESGAISPLYAVAILALVGMAGIGFDYGRIMALDTELQNAADQAALAAATQLDGTDGSRARATNAATNAFANAASPFVNETRFANDGSDRPITNLTFKYYDSYGANDTLGAESTTDQDAKVVEVTVNTRTVRYALTPVIGAIRGDAIGRAMATLEAATCNVPPMMFCVPNKSDGTADTAFPRSSDIGRGLKLHFKANGKDSPGNPNEETADTSVWAPGNFGFLDLEYLPKSGQNSTTGLNSDALGCTGETPTSNPGFRTPQGSALNSRFDLYTPPVNKCVTGNGDFCPSTNVRKNLVLKMPNGASDCSNPPNNIKANDWTDPASVGIPDPGYPQDTDFASTSGLVVGNGVWGADAWLSSHHGVTTAAAGIPNLDGISAVSRYEVYKWELEASTRLNPQFFVGTDGNKYCSFPRPVDQPPGRAASSTQKDRRILTVAAVDCTGLNGKSAVRVLRWVDLFLVQPVATTASDRNFFTEIVGPARLAGGGTGFQYYGRRKAVLIR